MIRIPRLQLRLRHQREIRHWAIEFAVVVVGVLLALLAAEWAKSRSDAGRLAAAEEAMAAELNEAALYLVTRDWLEPCIREQQERLATRIRQSGSSWQAYREHSFNITPVQAEQVLEGVLHVPRAELTSSAWQSALATGALDSMDRTRFATYIKLYRELELMQAQFNKELEAASTLSALTSDIQLTPQARQQYLRALYDWASATSVISNQEEFLTDLQNIGIADPAFIDSQREIFEERAREDFPDRRPCVGTFENPFIERAD